ncbi:DinB family protein [Streptosporangium sp. NPDC051023]|uniref:DinB family protein n=1 Tax=Streptosporangium sp. NPDC051023 TaxID=3155410 RepID=UPI00344E583D
MTDDRIDPPFIADEATMLYAWLDWHRETLAVKCAGLSQEQLSLRPCAPSTLSLLGLVRHITEVERYWFRNILNGEENPPLYWNEQYPDGDFDRLDSCTAEEALTRWRAEIEGVRELYTGLSLDTLGGQQRGGEDVSLRWILVHMIEEYARHNGHADIIREQIDGVTGE